MANGIAKPSDIRPGGDKLLFTFEDFARTDPTQATTDFEKFKEAREKYQQEVKDRKPLRFSLGVTRSDQERVDEMHQKQAEAQAKKRGAAFDKVEADALAQPKGDAGKSASGAPIGIDITRITDYTKRDQYTWLMRGNTRGGKTARGKQLIDQAYNYHLGNWLLMHVFGRDPSKPYDPEGYAAAVAEEQEAIGDGNTAKINQARNEQYGFLGIMSFAEYLQKGLDPTSDKETFYDQEALIRGYQKALDVEARVMANSYDYVPEGDTDAMAWELALNHELFDGDKRKPNSTVQDAIMYARMDKRREHPVIKTMTQKYNDDHLIDPDAPGLLNYMASRPGTPLYTDFAGAKQDQAKVQETAAMVREQRGDPPVTPTAGTPAPTVTPTATGTLAGTPTAGTDPVDSRTIGKGMGPLGRPPAEGISALPGMGMQSLGPRAVASPPDFGSAFAMPSWDRKGLDWSGMPSLTDRQERLRDVQYTPAFQEAMSQAYRDRYGRDPLGAGVPGRAEAFLRTINPSAQQIPSMLKFKQDQMRRLEGAGVIPGTSPFSQFFR